MHIDSEAHLVQCIQTEMEMWNNSASLDQWDLGPGWSRSPLNGIHAPLCHPEGPPPDYFPEPYKLNHRFHGKFYEICKKYCFHSAKHEKNRRMQPKIAKRHLVKFVLIWAFRDHVQVVRFSRKGTFWLFCIIIKIGLKQMTFHGSLHFFGFEALAQLELKCEWVYLKECMVTICARNAMKRLVLFFFCNKKYSLKEGWDLIFFSS